MFTLKAKVLLINNFSEIKYQHFQKIMLIANILINKNSYQYFINQKSTDLKLLIFYLIAKLNKI